MSIVSPIIILVVWIILAILDYIAICYDEWKKEGKMPKAEEAIFIFIICLLGSPIFFCLILYIFWKERREELNEKNNKKI